MSFDIQWDTICNDEELAQTFQDFLNSKLATLELPHYLANLQVVDFKFGDAAPDITIRDIDVPFKEFYVPTDDDSEVSDESSQFDDTNNESTKNDDMINKTIYGDTFQQDGKHALLNPSGSSSPNPFIKNRNTLLMPRRTNSGFVPTVGYSGIGLNGFGMNQMNNSSNRADSMDSETEYFQPSSGANEDDDQERIFLSLANGMTGLNLQNHNDNQDNAENFSEGEPTDHQFNSKGNNYPNNPQVNTSYSSDEPESSIDSRIDSLDIQLSIDLHWESHLYIEIICDLLVNYPAPNFIRLPVRLKITELKIHSLIVVACISKRVFISFLCDIESDDDDETTSNGTPGANNNSTDSRQDSRRSTTASNATTANKRTKGKERIDILQDMKIEGEIGNVSESAELWRENLLKPLQEKQQKQGSGGTMKKNNDLDVGSGSNFLSGIVNNDEIGDGNGLVLRNIGKIEKFLMNAFRGLIIDELAWPGWIELDFNETMSDTDKDSERENDVFEDQEGPKMQRTYSNSPHKRGRAGSKSEDKLGIRSIRSVRSVSTDGGRRPVSIVADSVYSTDSFFTSDEE